MMNKKFKKILIVASLVMSGYTNISAEDLAPELIKCQQEEDKLVILWKQKNPGAVKGYEVEIRTIFDESEVVLLKGGVTRFEYPIKKFEETPVNISVTAIDGKQQQHRSQSQEAEIKHPDTLPVMQLSANLNAEQKIVLSWKKLKEVPDSIGVTKYYLYKSFDGENYYWVEDFEMDKGLYTDIKNIFPGGKYWYELKFSSAYNGQYVIASNAAQIEVPDNRKPGKVQNLSVNERVDDTGKVYVKLDWRDPSYVAHGVSVKEYEVYRRAPGEEAKPVFKNDATKYNDYDVKSGTRYTYIVAAVGSNSQKGETAEIEISLSVAKQKPLTEISIARTEKSILLKWEYEQDMEDLNVNIYRSEKANTGFEKLNNKLYGVKWKKYYDRTVERGKRYFYRLETENAEGVKSARSHLLVQDAP